MISAFSRVIALSSALILLGAGCTKTSSETTTLPFVPIPSDFPADILLYPGAQTYAAAIQNGVPTLGQITSSSTREVVTWINQNYDDNTRDLHLFSDQGTVKLYAFQSLDYRYNVRLEIATDSSTTKIVTQKVPIGQVQFE
jgi:hypothetical protein